MSTAIKPVRTEPNEMDTIGGQIFGLIPKIMADVGSIEKNRRNVQQNYAFRGIDDVFAAFQEPLSKYGVFYVPEVLKHDTTERTTKSGGVLIYTTLLVAYTFYAPDGSNVHATVVGEAMDSGDKSANKAMSAALKYALLQIFCVPTHANEDADNETHDIAPKVEYERPYSKPKPPSEKETLMQGVHQACKLLNSAGDVPPWTPARLKEFVKTELGAATVDDLGVEEVRELLKRLSLRLDGLNEKGSKVETALALDDQILKCECGIPRVRVDGKAKTGPNKGQPYAMWACANRIKEHKPIFIDLDAEAERKAEDDEYDPSEGGDF